MAILKKFLDLLSYPRGVVASLVAGSWTILMSAVVLLVGIFLRSRRFMDFAIVHLWCRPILWVSGVEVVGSGRDYATEGQKGCLILFNHSSLMDIPVLYSYFPRSFRFGAKIELFKIPFFGKAMRAVGVLPIDRGNRDKVMRVYEEAIARVNQGECFALAPEGTRSSEAKIGPFKKGPFEFAINAGMDILPVVVVGAYEVLSRKAVFINQGVWHRRVLVEITPRISTDGMTLEQIEGLQQKVREQMVGAFERLNKEINHRK